MFQAIKIPADPFHVYFVKRSKPTQARPVEWLPICRMLEADFRAAILDRK